MAKRTDKPALIAFAPNKADLVLLDRLQRRMGIRNRSDVLRLAIRRLAAAEGLSETEELAATGTDG